MPICKVRGELLLFQQRKIAYNRALAKSPED
jgi:hypothetical protein